MRTSEEAAAAKAKERAEKAKLYIALREKTIAKVSPILKYHIFALGC